MSSRVGGWTLKGRSSSTRSHWRSCGDAAPSSSLPVVRRRPPAPARMHRSMATASKTARPTQYYLNKLPRAAAELLPALAAVGQPSPGVAPGTSWREPWVTESENRSRSVEVDVEVVERGLRGHVETERALAPPCGIQVSRRCRQPRATPTSTSPGHMTALSSSPRSRARPIAMKNVSCVSDSVRYFATGHSSEPKAREPFGRCLCPSAHPGIQVGRRPATASASHYCQATSSQRDFESSWPSAAALPDNGQRRVRRSRASCRPPCDRPRSRSGHSRARRWPSSRGSGTRRRGSGRAAGRCADRGHRHAPRGGALAWRGARRW